MEEELENTERIKDFHVSVRLKNNQLYARRKEMGLSQKALAEAVGISKGMYSSYERLGTQPFGHRGGVKESARNIAAYLGVSIAVLWPQAVQKIVKSFSERTVDGEEILELVGNYTQRLALPPDELYEEKERAEKVHDALLLLENPRHQEVLNRRFGIDRDEETLDEACATFSRGDDNSEGITRERLRQIEVKALRLMRHSSRSSMLKEFE